MKVAAVEAVPFALPSGSPTSPRGAGWSGARWCSFGFARDEGVEGLGEAVAHVAPRGADAASLAREI